MSLKKFDEFINESRGVDLGDKLPSDVKSVADVEQFILTLAKTQNLYHFDDDAKDIVSSNGGRVFTDSEAEVINKLMEKSFEVCDRHYVQSGKLKEHGFWEGFIKGVFLGYVAFSASEDPEAKLYVVAGSGGPGKVKYTSYKDYQEMESQELDEAATDAWFSKLNPVT